MRTLRVQLVQVRLHDGQLCGLTLALALALAFALTLTLTRPLPSVLVRAILPLPLLLLRLLLLLVVLGGLQEQLLEVPRLLGRRGRVRAAVRVGVRADDLVVAELLVLQTRLLLLVFLVLGDLGLAAQPRVVADPLLRQQARAERNAPLLIILHTRLRLLAHTPAGRS